MAKTETEAEAIRAAAKIASRLTGIPVAVIERQMLAIAERNAPQPPSRPQ